MNKLQIIIAFLFAFNFCYSQSVSISGFVYDAQSKERLIYATVIDLKTNIACNTDEHGFFSLNTRKEFTKLRVSFVGYNPDTFHLNLNKDTLLICYLKSNNNIEEVTITGNNTGLSHNGSTIQAKQFAKLPVLAGEPDIMKSLQLLPGVQSVSEGQSGFSVKGGDNYQNLILLDGVPVYNSNHLFGFFSIFNEHAVQDITMYKGDFPARYGGRLASVVDIQTKEGNAKRVAGSVSLGLLASSIDIEGPVIKDKTTFFISGRHSYLNLMATPIIKYYSGYESASYGFYDYNAKITHRFNNRNKLIFNLYRSHDSGQTEVLKTVDVSNYRTEENVSWGNLISSLTWNRVINSKLILNTMIHYSKYDYLSANSFGQTEGVKYSESQNNYQTSIYDEGANINLNWYKSQRLTMKTGIAYTYQKYHPGVEASLSSNVNDTENPYQKVNNTGNVLNKSNEISLYIDNDLHLNKELLLHAGLRYTFYKNNIGYNNLEPRLNLEYLHGLFKYNLSYTVAHQYKHMLSNSRISQATDLWVPSTRTVGPELSNQYSFNVTYQISKAVTFTTELYYKKLNNLVAYKDGASYLFSSSWEELVTQGNGSSKGISLTVEKKTGSTSGWITYTLSNSKRQFPEINDGDPFPFDYDHRHDFKLVLLHKFSPKFDIGYTFTYHSGNYISYGNIMNETFLVYMKRNAYQLPVYHRMDLTLNYHIQKSKFEQVITLGVYNLYNRKNIYTIEYTESPLGSGIMMPPYVFQKKSLFPIVPSLIYRITFN